MRTAILILWLVCCGCSTPKRDDYVVSGTGTMFGIQIVENPITQLYSLKLGYDRSEMTLVPSNGPPVIVEVYSGLFSRSGGTYQRLAVGSAAVVQPGAAYLFSKDENGNTSYTTFQSIAAKFQSQQAQAAAASSTNHSQKP